MMYVSKLQADKNNSDGDSARLLLPWCWDCCLPANYCLNLLVVAGGEGENGSSWFRSWRE